MKTEVKMRNVETEHDVVVLHEISELIGDVKDYLYDLVEKSRAYTDKHDDALAVRLIALRNCANLTDYSCDQVDELLAERLGN